MTASLVNQIVVADVTLTAAAGSGEYSFQVPQRAKHLRFGLRPNADSADLYYYTTSVGNSTNITSQSTVPYKTISHLDLPREEYFYGAVMGGQTLYFQSSHASEVLEISYIIDP